MSDTDSVNSTSNIPASSASRMDEHLQDHRNQVETLPPPEESAQELQQPQVQQQPRPQMSKTRTNTESAPRFRRNSRSRSISENAGDEAPGILMNVRKARARAELAPMMKLRTNESGGSDMGPGHHKRERRMLRSSLDLEADSHASRSSQETEEDVCFPMLREHVRINGIDFDEIDDFINEERDNEELMRRQTEAVAQENIARVKTTGMSIHTEASAPSKNAIKYTPKNILMKSLTRMRTGEVDAETHSAIPHEKLTSDSSEEDYIYEKRTIMTDGDSSDNVRFGGTRINDGDLILPDRFSFFHSDNEETVHAPDLASLLLPGQSTRELFKNGEGTWWLDCTCPTDSEMKTLAKAFGIHPLTAEDIRMQETREKVELFRNYYFVCFHTFEPDKESEDYLEPINVYIVVFREGVLTFHFSPILHPANVRRRVRQLRDYVDVSADWLCYAMIDDITDGFAPVITAIEYEADAIEDSVLVARQINFSSMLRKIGESRRKVMTLMRLLSNKADVIKMFAKRCQDEAFQQGPLVTGASRVNLSGLGSSFAGNTSPPPSTQGISFGPGPGAPPGLMTGGQFQMTGERVQPRADIALYLGDIQDHVVTMFQNLSAYEKIFSRSHANYLAQLQVESFNSNLTVTKILGNVTLIGTLFLPLNVITGLFGMNVKIPGQDGSNLGWFFGILGFMLCAVIGLFVGVKLWLKHIERHDDEEENSKKSIKSFSLKYKSKEAAKSIISFPNRYD
ncbi:CIC11C00000000639 [Sungouiella intermedia]|uniref:CIC11C00000000639 n=1 Tax=Sungouiella intermedia TaxID=45354 RepID=A0A1L0C5W9_9ASCO|nr:CIC11C00000000639 [[Candida] intermedia]